MYGTANKEDAMRNDIVESLAANIMQKYSLLDAQSNIEPCQEPGLTYGRVGCLREVTFNAATLFLEGTRELSDGQSVPLDVTGVDRCALFSGQVVVVRGINPTGDYLYASKIYCDAPPPLPAVLPKLSERDGPLHFIVASGPYTPTDTMTYQPLVDLIAHVKKEQPHVLILIGPFIDESHPHIINGFSAELYDDNFNKMIDKIATELEGSRTQVVLVSSSRDVTGAPVYPTPPYSLSKACPSNFTLASDPVLLDVGGLIVGVSATDVIKQMAGREIEHQWFEMPNKLHRMAQHVLNQGCFYPLYPPAEEVNLDVGLFSKHAFFDVMPHVLVLPSDMRYFAKVISGCLVVNPERMSKGLVGGTFARFEIKPPTESMTPEDFVKNNIYCQIVKI